MSPSGSAGAVAPGRMRAPAAASSALRHPAKFSWLTLAAALVALLAVAPIVGIGIYAARGSGDLWPHLIANVLPHALLDTVLLLVGVGIVVSIVGIGCAWLVATCSFPGRSVFDWALLLPLAVPTYIVAYAYLDLLHPIGPVQSALRAVLGISDPRGLRLPDIRSLGGCIFVLGFVLYPYVYVGARAMFLMQSAAVLDVARTLGASRLETLFRIALPLARPAIVVGLSLALMEAVNDIGAAEFLGVRTLTVSIYVTWVSRHSVEGASQIALVMLAGSALLVAAERGARRSRSFSRGRDFRPVALQELSPAGSTLACLACALPILIGFVAPAGYLANAAFVRIAAFGWPQDLPVWIWNSVSYSAVATLVTCGLGLLLAYAARVEPGSAIFARLGTLGYAIPGTVLAVGLLAPLATLDSYIDAASRFVLGLSPGLVLSGSGFALVFAYAARFLTIGLSNAEAGYSKISHSLDHAARSLGEGRGGVLRRVHLPLLRPAVLGAALLIFVDCMKELSATLLLRPFNFESLATYVYGEAARGTYEDGAVAALAIVLVGLLPIALLSRISRARGMRGYVPLDV